MSNELVLRALRSGRRARTIWRRILIRDTRIAPMVRREGGDRPSSAPRCSSPAGASPASVSAGAPSSRPQASVERPVARAGCREPLRREPARGPQHHVKPAASSDLQPESRAAHVTAKATSTMPQSGGTRVVGLGGVEGAARVQGDERNTRGPSAPPVSGQRDSYKPTAKSSRAQRESEGVVVPLMTATNNAVGGKGLYFGRARNEGTCQGMAGKTGPNHPAARPRDDHAQQPRHELGTSAKRLRAPMSRLRPDSRSVFRVIGRRSVHAAPRRPSVSRGPEIGTHGLKGGPALSRPFLNRN